MAGRGCVWKGERCRSGRRLQESGGRLSEGSRSGDLQRCMSLMQTRRSRPAGAHRASSPVGQPAQSHLDHLQTPCPSSALSHHPNLIASDGAPSEPHARLASQLAARRPPLLRPRPGPPAAIALDRPPGRKRRPPRPRPPRASRGRHQPRPKRVRLPGAASSSWAGRARAGRRGARGGRPPARGSSPKHERLRADHAGSLVPYPNPQSHDRHEHFTFPGEEQAPYQHAKARAEGGASPLLNARARARARALFQPPDS